MQNTRKLHFPPKETPTHPNPHGEFETTNFTENSERIGSDWRHSGDWNNINPRSGNWKIPNLRHSGDWNIPNPNITTDRELSSSSAIMIPLESKNPQNHSFGIPTLFVCGILSGILSLICYVINHKLSIR